MPLVLKSHRQKVAVARGAGAESAPSAVPYIIYVFQVAWHADMLQKMNRFCTSAAPDVIRCVDVGFVETAYKCSPLAIQTVDWRR